jgi:hypothetical protein
MKELTVVSILRGIGSLFSGEKESRMRNSSSMKGFRERSLRFRSEAMVCRKASSVKMHRSCGNGLTAIGTAAAPWPVWLEFTMVSASAAWGKVKRTDDC